MRELGVWLVGLGITLLVMSVFPVAAARNAAELVGWLACAALVPGSLIVVGVALVRGGEGQASDPKPDTPPDAAEAGDGGLLARFAAFDLNQLNGAGWLLLLATLGFIGAEVAALVWLVGPGGWGGGWLGRVGALLVLVLAIGFFVVVRWLLRVIGVSIYRQ